MGQPTRDAIAPGALLAEDFDGDGRDDLAAGVPLESLGDIPDAGRVSILSGTAAGLTTVGNWSFSQTGPLADKAETADGFGSSLTGHDSACRGHPRQGDMRL